MLERLKFPRHGFPLFRRMISGISMIAVLANGFASSAPGACPSYRDFATPSTKSSHRIAPVVPPELAEAKGYRQVWDDAKKPPNFAGKYRISIDTCGTSMIMVMIANLDTGHARRVGCVDHTYDGEYPELPIGLRYRADSRLLIAYGCLSSAYPCGAHFYKLDEEELHVICVVPFKGNIMESIPGLNPLR